jgi:hypothetical protein
MWWSVRGLGQGGSKVFNFYGLKLEINQTRKIGLILPILTEFDRFRVLTRFNTLFTC